MTFSLEVYIPCKKLMGENPTKITQLEPGAEIEVLDHRRSKDPFIVKIEDADHFGLAPRDRKQDAQTENSNHVIWPGTHMQEYSHVFSLPVRTPWEKITGVKKKIIYTPSAEKK
jgi:hypothetical protein